MQEDETRNLVQKPGFKWDTKKPSFGLPSLLSLLPVEKESEKQKGRKRRREEDRREGKERQTQ